jgi:hypothetical protein
MKGYGKKKESIQVLIDRIQWSNHYPIRMNISARYGIYAIIISFLSSIVYESKLGACGILQNTIVIWIVLMGLHSFFGHHSDKFKSYFIDDNLEKVREKLHLLSDIRNLTVNQTKFDRNHNCTNFVYQKFEK